MNCKQIRISVTKCLIIDCHVFKFNFHAHWSNLISVSREVEIQTDVKAYCYLKRNQFANVLQWNRRIGFITERDLIV